MLDIKMIRERPDFVRERLATRGAGDEKAVDMASEFDQQRRKTISEVEALKSQRNRVSKEIGALMGQKKIEEAEAKKLETRDLGERIAGLDQQVKGIDATLEDILIRLPNLPHTSVALGKTAEDNPVIRTWGDKATFSFKPKSHVELCESLKLIDFPRGAKISGSGFLLYTNWGARLERALIQFLLDLHIQEHGYTEVSPPYIVSDDCMTGVGQFPKFRDQAYAVREGLDDNSLGSLYLVPTAEAPVATCPSAAADSALPIVPSASAAARATAALASPSNPPSAVTAAASRREPSDEITPTFNSASTSGSASRRACA
ncbi:MAG: hypothetical protein H7X97_11535, partial [Opitutaceae bacterium]|nr:hypothetical protein [Verrucomicrobiales bacterium]